MLSSQSQQEFTSARQRAFIEEWLSYLTGRPSGLLSFEEVKNKLRLQDSWDSGLHEIELDRIVGSTGRYRDFTRTFLPKSDQTADRWRRIKDVADEQGYPPIEVYQVGEVYFVRDGNHRVSVARQNGAKTIEAYVIEFKTTVPIDKDDDLDDILLKAERTRFFEETRLDKIRPEQNVVFTEPGRYRLVQEHIAFHKYFREIECNCEISYEEAVGSWYDHVFTATINLIRQREVMKHFPNRTEADLYAWLLLHRAELEDKLNSLGQLPDDELLEAVTRDKSPNPFVRLMGLFQRKLNLEELPLRVERSKFLESVRLDEIRPDHGIDSTESGCYQVVKEHIDVHKYLRETEINTEIAYHEAVASWYDHVYLPVVQLIRDKKVMEHFPGNTETDLYLWILARRVSFEENQGAVNQLVTEKIIAELEQECRSSSILHLAHHFWQRLNRPATVIS